MDEKIKPTETIEKLANGTPVRIVALGDSLTYGWMVRKGYIDYLKEMIQTRFPRSRLTFINKGIAGDTAEGGLYRVEIDVLNQNPDCVFIQFALNDAFSGYTPDEFRNSIQNIIKKIKENSESEIVLITSVCLGNNRENLFVEKFYQQLVELADQCQLPIAKVNEYWKKEISESIEFRKLVQSDMVHPTSEGYRLMAEAVMKVFECEG